MRKLPWVQYDVFTSRAFEGNALAVFTDATGLSDTEMQRIAKETNLSETTFIFPRDAAMEKERGAKVRIFTVDEELPFAGHPTLGTAMYLHHFHGGAAQVDLDLKAGKVPVRFEQRNGLAFGEMKQLDPKFGESFDRASIASLAGVQADDFRDDVPIQTVSTGVAFAIAPVRTLAALQRVRLDWKRAEEYLAKSEAKFIFFVTQETVSPDAALHARMIFYNGEDPATGSASGCCIAWAVKHGVVVPDKQVMIEQGIECRRPSQIYVRAARNGDHVVNVRVGGHAIEVARGEFFLP